MAFNMDLPVLPSRYEVFECRAEPFLSRAMPNTMTRQTQFSILTRDPSLKLSFG
jgi:hypothetical protein